MLEAMGFKKAAESVAERGNVANTRWEWVPGEKDQHSFTRTKTRTKRFRRTRSE